MKIAHLSDLHICLKYKRNNLATIKRLVKKIANSNIDHLIISGDISDNSKEEDFLWFRNVLKENGLLDSERSSVVIGNHDIFGGVQTASDIIEFPSKCTSVDFKEKVNQFVGYFEELFKNVYSPSEKSIFPFVKNLRDIVLVGINSVDKYSKIRNPFASNGYVTKEQISNIQKIFDLDFVANKIKIVAIHHHFYKNNISSKSSEHAIWSRLENFTMKLRRKKRLIKLFQQNNVDLVLHGHSHEVKEYSRKGIKFLNAGGTIDNDGSLKPGYFVVDLSPNKIKTYFDFVSEKSLDNSRKRQTSIYLPSLAN